MYNKFISTNKNEFNTRRVEELDILILEKEKELKEISGFLNSLKIRLELRKLYKEINTHGSEVLEYEYINSLN